MSIYAVIAVGCLFVVGCGGTVTDSSGSQSGTRADKTTPPGGGGATAKATPVSSGNSGGAPSEGVGICLHDLGPTTPLLFRKLTHEEQVCDGPGSNCVDFFEARADCGLMFQSNNDRRDATAGADDCAVLARFATSQFLFNGLNDPVSCLPSTDGNPPEMTEIELTTGPGPRKKTALCDEEPFTTLRACVHGVVSKYFPSK